MAKNKSIQTKNPLGIVSPLSPANSASYELTLAAACLQSIAEDLGNEAGCEDQANILWSVLDHITRAKALIDDDTESLLRVNHMAAEVSHA